MNEVRPGRGLTLGLVLLAVWAMQGCDADPAPMDGGGMDGEAPAAECERDVECDDGVVCNGSETCEAGECAAAAPLDCDDQDACTVDSCSESEGGCLHEPLDEDGDGHASVECGGDDCADDDPNRFPGNVEVCDAEGHDEDCDAMTFGQQDADADSEIDDRCCNTDDAGQTRCGTDCDDVRASVQPGAVEACDGLDNDCDGAIDEGVATEGFVDEDGDLHGDPGRAISACAGEPGFSSIGDDCDDGDPARHGAQPEVCDDVDNDCDGSVDEDTREVSWYLDMDGDGFGDPNEDPIRSCTPVSGRSLLASDCDDTVAAVNPAAAEQCDGIDNDCNGQADYRIAPGDFEDDDGDGFVDSSCDGGEDCDDQNASIAGGVQEICDGRDNDCDGTVDEDTSPVVWFADLDADGYGSSSSGAVVSCVAVSGHSLRGGDCDDRNVSRRPGAAERCDGLDDDCDGGIDEGLIRSCGTDVGACSSGRQACSNGIWSTCNGTAPTTETCNLVDDDCDGAVDDGIAC